MVVKQELSEFGASVRARGVVVTDDPKADHWYSNLRPLPGESGCTLGVTTLQKVFFKQVQCVGGRDLWK